MRRVSIVLGVALLAAVPALALDVTEKIEIKEAPDKVWAAIGDKAKEVISGIYKAGLDSIMKKF